MTKSNTINDPALAVRRLAREHPEWLPVLEAAVAVAADADEFAGAWVVEHLARRGTQRWVPNLRLLASYGLIEKSGPSTRGGRRAYYVMPARAEVARALEAWRLEQAERRPPLRFIASGASTQLPSDAARRSGDLEFEPRSWR